MAEAVLTRRSVVKNEYQLLADITVSSATTNVDITGLNLVKGEEYELVCDYNNTSGSGANYFIFANANYTNSNYYKQYLFVDNTSLASARANNAQFGYADASRKSYAKVYIKATNSGYFIFQSHMTREYSSTTPRIFEFYGTSTFTLSSITSLRIASDITNAIGIGSRFQLYKVGA